MIVRLRPVAAALLAVALIAASAFAQSIMLQIQPKVGDTLRMRIEQETEMSFAGKVRDADTTMTQRSSVVTLSRGIVIATDDEGATVRSIIDSIAVELRHPDPFVAARSDQVRRALQGREVRVRFSKQGSAAVIEADPDIPRDLQSVFSQLPATFPTYPVSVGTTWMQRIHLPEGGQRQLGGTLEAQLRLDSVTHRGKKAHISLRGTLTRDSATAATAPSGGRLTMTGTVTGFMILDRARGWVTEASTEMVVKSHSEPPSGSVQRPMSMRLRLVQRLRTMDKR